MAKFSSEAQGRPRKMEVRWRKSDILGLTPMTNEFYLWDGTTVVKARGARRTTATDRWDKPAIQTITKCPSNRHAHNAPPRVILEDHEPADHASTAPPAMPKARDHQVRNVDLLRQTGRGVGSVTPPFKQGQTTHACNGYWGDLGDYLKQMVRTFQWSWSLLLLRWNSQMRSQSKKRVKLRIKT